eukprot:gene11696-46856_t
MGGVVADLTRLFVYLSAPHLPEAAALGGVLTCEAASGG